MFICAKNSLTETQISKLNAVADLKVGKIISYFERIDVDIATAQDGWSVKKNMPIVSAYLHDQSNSKYIIAKQKLDDQFKSFQKVNEYANFVLLNTQGELVYEAKPGHEHKIDWVKAHKGVLIKPKTGIYFSPVLQYGETTKEYAMLASALAHDEHGKLIGTIVIEIDMMPIYEAIQDATDLGTTGETLIVEKRGNRVVYLNPLRYDKNAVFNKAIAFGDGEESATSKQNGAMITIDYRGKQTLSAWRYISFLNWDLVVKIDIDEAFAMIYFLEQLLWFLVGIALLVGILTAFAIAKSIADPIYKLHEGMEIIGGGNLDHRVGTEVLDEVGQFSRAFDEMVANLKKVTASRDDLDRVIKEREKAEEELVAAKKIAESASKAKSEFLSTMSHELRTPLNSIIGFSEVLVDETFGTLNKKQKEYAVDVLTSGQHLLSLINDVLDISKVEAGKMELRLSEFDIKSLIVNSLIMIKEKAMNHNIKLIENVDESLGTILADERKTKQIIYNLLSNAIKFTPDGGKIGVEVKKTDSNEVLITVWDTGIGIEEEDRAKIFVEFKQIDSELNQKYDGTGLGLSLVKKLVELHGGKIWFESEGKDKGSRFNFVLPVRQKNVAS